MLGLNVNLNAVGISATTGSDLIAARDQVKTMLPRTASADGPAGTAAKTTSAAGAQALTPDQQKRVDELKQIDRKVHDHEQAHIAAGGGIVTGGPDYTYTYGPDGKPYATAGEVGIDTAKEEKPQANIDKGRVIQRAALAPQDPSPQDYRVAALGAELEAAGRSDLSRAQALERSGAAEQVQQQRAARAAETGSPASAAAGAPASRQSANVDQLIRNAYATVTPGSASAGRVDVYA